MDFTLVEYRRLLTALQKADYNVLPFTEFLARPAGKQIVLRHDVDKWPLFSLATAKIEHQLAIRGTYYFRTLPSCFDPKIIKEISSLDHEIGYHYEDISLVTNLKVTATEKQLADSPDAVPHSIRAGITSFKENLNKLRTLVSIKTICMHGSPLSRWDSRLLWKYYDYRDFGIEAEPYFDIDFTEMKYLTDTGRRWDGESVSVRDRGLRELNRNVDGYSDWKVKPVRGSLMRMTPDGAEFQRRNSFHSTKEIVNALETRSFPEQAMLAIHPQRWTDNLLLWGQEFVMQNAKNVVKYYFARRRF